MRLTAVQLPARFDAVAEQLAFAETLLEGGPATDVILFSEAAFTGYVSKTNDFDLTRFAEPTGGPTSRALAHFAKRFNALVVGPLIEREGTQCFNALTGYTPNGARALHYRKRHPWMPETWASPGTNSLPVVSFRGTTFTAAICFDVHFLAAESRTELTASDVLLFASAWVDDEGDSRPAHLATLGIDVLNANWGDGEPRLPGQGGSLFMNRRGELTSRLAVGPGRLDFTRR